MDEQIYILKTASWKEGAGTWNAGIGAWNDSNRTPKTTQPKDAYKNYIPYFSGLCTNLVIQDKHIYYRMR